MQLDKFVVGVVIFSLFVVAGSLIFGNTIDNYEIETNTSEAGFDSVYNTLNETYDLSQDMKEQTLDGEIEGEDESWESMTKNSYSSIRLVRNTFTLVGDIMDAVARQIGIPRFFVSFAVVIMTTLIIFAIVYLIFRVRS